ncbi:hypothetical protein [Paraburkholderia sp. DHOC27]|uniref:hypothetical protein n=1 Tax=Paraburkholderia sp. DHOC27 TaxID=2303330 RepID=UPI000E3C24D4|nr:hypothetical protein [Paraburkholderia sp. DHOC27]RFU48029.1 hypothetical protein D0B32_10950 [Paraburkholderia sp. DHOC27]
MHYFDEQKTSEHILKNLSVTDQIRLALAMDMSEDKVTEKFGGSFVTIKNMAQRSATTMKPEQVARIAEMGREQVKSAETERLKGLGITNKTAVLPSTLTSANTGSLYYPVQQAGIVLPPATTPLVTALTQFGAMQPKPNIRILTQSQLLQASEITEGSGYPAAAPNIEFSLTDNRKFGLILLFSREMLAMQGDSENVVSYMQQQLEFATNLATDAYAYATLTANAAAATTAQAALNAFEADPRTAVWIGAPATLASLRSAAEQDVGTRGGEFMKLPALASLAVPQGKLLLVDTQRTAVYDGFEEVMRADEATVVPDTEPNGSATPPVFTFQTGQIAMRITKYADVLPLHQTQLVTLG